MNKKYYYLDKIEEVFKRLYFDIFLELRSEKLSVFLIGENENNNKSLRFLIKNALEKKDPYYESVDVYYPEQIFQELLNTNRHDLLALENLLAESVHVVVIVLESPGSIAELGAFSNNEKYKDKLIVLVDDQYRGASSFIISGPIRHLENNKKSSVIYTNYKIARNNTVSLTILSKELKSTIKSMSKDIDVSHSLINPISAKYFVQLALYIFGVMNEQQLTDLMVGTSKMVKESTVSRSNVEKYLNTALHILMKDKQLRFSDNVYQLNDNGRRHLKNSITFSGKKHELVNKLDELRFDILELERKQIKCV